jgi:ATP-binding cassette subfamily B protein RaxB
LSDIVLHPRDNAQASTPLAPNPNGHSIEFRNVWFRYADGEPWVLKGINLHIEPEDSVVILGMSGGGKTTLIKLLLGLLVPNEGKVLVDGMNLEQIDKTQFRSFMGTVMQDDQLFAGSIMENVAFFDPNLDIEWVIDCLQQAGLYKEVLSMPMGLQTLVGDMGTTLSGGQKQRLLVARALYKRPQIMILDEATSHLDKENQEQVHHALKRMGRTHISITHRLELVSPSDRIFTLQNGQLTPQPTSGIPLSISSDQNAE